MNQIKSILVTGGTGTFGAAFIRFLLLQPQIERVVVYSRGEHTQAALRATLAGVHGHERVRWMLGDVRDEKRLERAFAGCDSVVHAAALKRIEVGQYNPDEMVKTNVIGTMNIIQAAMAAGVKRVVGLSSDKAYQPISPYGQSKALAESLLLAANSTHKGPAFSVVRYGNIWNANGSVLPTWRALHALGLPLPISDPDCTRFFMTIDQAVAFVWDLLISMRGNELKIPHWLPAYRLGDLVAAFSELYPDAQFSSADHLPAWEKMHESMCDGLCSVIVPRLAIEELKDFINEKSV